jgi:hypothetical protein
VAEQRLELGSSEEAAVRMYGQGFGDCFLLAFPRVQAGREPDTKNPVYVVIDSGVFPRTPGSWERMRAVARSINAATGGTIDLLVATHEHHDHLCGFEYAKQEWKAIGVRRVWVAWTEDRTHPATQAYDREKEALKLQAEMALRVVEQHKREDPTLARAFGQVRSLVGFAAGGTGKLKPPDELSKSPDRVLDDLADDPGRRFKPLETQTERDFCEPGQVRAVPDTAVDAYVLGPPTAEGRLAQDFDETEVYPEQELPPDEVTAARALDALKQRLRLAAASNRAERETFSAALRWRLAAADGVEPSPDDGAPFPSRLALPYSAAREDSFFRARYFEARSDRQIETEWLHSFGQLALQVDKVINNTSLVLAFRLPSERVLLFVGDAQVGNWLSWHEIQPKDWRRPGGGGLSYRPTARQLLAKTAIYKVGHHGSHNATLKAKGLEMMPDGLIAFVPVSQFYPQKEKGKGWPIPLTTLIDALWKKSGGQVVFPHEHADYDYAGTPFANRVHPSGEHLPAMKRQGQEIESAVPLWREVRL